MPPPKADVAVFAPIEKSQPDALAELRQPDLASPDDSHTWYELWEADDIRKCLNLGVELPESPGGSSPRALGFELSAQYVGALVSSAEPLRPTPPQHSLKDLVSLVELIVPDQAFGQSQVSRRLA